MAGAGQAGAEIGMGVGMGIGQAGTVGAGSGQSGAATGAGNAAEAVIMPRLDMTTEEMTILRWMKVEGEPVDKGEALLEVMTEKIAIEIDAPASGYVRGIRFAPETVVPVGEVIAYIAAEAGGTVSGELRGMDGSASGAAGKSAPVIDGAPNPGAGRDVAVSGSSERATVGSAQSNSGIGGIVRAAPLARRIAADLGVDLGRITGTGPGGRVLADDVRAFATARGDNQTGAVSRPEVAQGAMLADQSDAPRAGDAGVMDDDVSESRLTPTRRAIARRMEASWRTAPHVTLTINVDMSEAAAFRERLRGALAAEGSDVSFTWNSLIAWVAVQALTRRPELNATLEDDVLRRYADIHLGMAVDTPAGLLVPVIRAAQRLRPAQLAAALAQAAAKAVGGGLQPADMRGGTFTITNLGAFGIGAFTPVLNPPQVAILGVGAVRDHVIPVDGEPAVRPVCTFSLSFDHRAADGADGARYLSLLKELLLNPHRLVV